MLGFMLWVLFFEPFTFSGQNGQPAVIPQPDHPELKDDWLFLWFENEYVIDTVTTFLLAANAADDALS
jgi:hypothetical protein